MNRTIRIAVIVALALAGQGLLARAFGNDLMWIDLPLVAVVYAGLTGGSVAGLLTGTLVGLAQDTMVGGVLGIGGLAKSLAGFFSGAAGTQFIVTQTMSRSFVFVGGSLVNAAVIMGLYAMLGLRHFDQPWLDVAAQAAFNGFGGALVFAVTDVFPGVRERWRVRRAYRKRERFR
jgi:rod shape-determining protein MreD